MNVLLDSNVIVSGLEGTDAVYERLRAAAGREPAFWVSSATVWELNIKAASGKLALPEDLRDRLVADGLRELAVSWRHAEEAGRLPQHHGDPFDRMLVAQARLEGLSLATSDPRMHDYDVTVIDLQ